MNHCGRTTASYRYSHSGIRTGVGEFHILCQYVMTIYLRLTTSTTRCRHHAETFSDGRKRVRSLESGVWHVYHVDDATHISLAPVWFGTSRQEALWKDIGRWLRAADDALKS